MLEQRGGVVAVFGKGCDANAGSHRDFLVADHEWATEQGQHALGNRCNDLRVVDPGQDDGELVAPEACELRANLIERRARNEVTRAKLLLQPIGYCLQQVVAGVVA
ncbi:MAG TPA: hypothetical protein PKA30_14410, partial [Accumulibacter sp.]|nr:hypothetical protein [Accumulibacter sp.]